MQLMGKLLERFGDVSASVRAATANVARGIMGNLSNQGALNSTANLPARAARIHGKRLGASLSPAGKELEGWGF